MPGIGGDFESVGLDATIRGMSQYAANAKKLTGINKGIQAGLQRTAAAAQLFGRAVRAAVKIGAVAVAVGIAASINVFKNFDQAMTESIAIMGDVSDAMRQEMEKAARDVAKTTTFSMTQAAESFFFLASAGLSAKQSIAALPQVAAFAQAGAFDMATATDLLTDAQSALGLVTGDTAQDIENMVRVSDVLVTANTKANATVEQLATALTREAAAAMKSFSIDVEEGVAVLQAFADQGIKGEIAGTSLARILRLMTSAAKNNSEAYAGLGIAVFDSEENINSMADIVADLEVALLGLTDVQRIAALETLGFTARVQGVILPLLGTSQAIRDYETANRSAFGKTADVAEKQLESLAAQFSLLRSAIEDVLFTIGKELEPGLRALVRILRDDVIPVIEQRLPQAIARMKDVFNDVKPALKAFADTFRSGIETILPIVKSLFDFINNNKAAMIASIAAIGAIIVVSFGPISIAAVAIVGLIALIGLIRDNWDTLRRETLQILGAIGRFIDKQMGFWDELIIGTVTKIVNFVQRHWGQIFSIIKGVMNAIRLEVEARLRFIFDAFQVFNAVLHGKWDEAWAALKDLVLTQLRLLREQALNSLNLLKDVFSLAFEVIGNAVIAAVEKMVNKVIDGINKMGDALNKVTGLARAIKIPIPKLGEIDHITLGRIRRSGEKIVTELAKSIRDSGDEVTEALADVVADTTLDFVGDEDGDGPTLDGDGGGVGGDIAKAAARVGKISGISFVDAFAEAIRDLPGIVENVLGGIGRIAVRPTIESAGEDVELARLRIAESQTEEKAEAERAVRLADIAKLETTLSQIRKRSATITTALEEDLASVRATSVKQITDLEGQLVAIARQRRRILGEPEPPPDPVDVSDLVGTLEDAEGKLAQLREVQKVARQSENIELFKQASQQIREQEGLVTSTKAAIEARLAAEEQRIQREIELKEREFAREEARIERGIAAQQELVEAEEVRVAAEIAALERLRGPNERKLADIQDEIEALDDLAKARGLERDLLLARIRASNNLLQSDRDIIEALEKQPERVDAITAALLDLDPATVSAVDALVLLQLGLEDFAQGLLEVLAIARRPVLGAGTAASMFAPRFHQGGIVPGARGQEVPAILQAGEMVIPAVGTVSVATASLAALQAPQQAVAQGGASFHTEVHTTDSRPSTIANAVRMVDIEQAARMRSIFARGIR